MIPYRDDQGPTRFTPVTAALIVAWVGLWVLLARSSSGTVRSVELGYGLRPDLWRATAAAFGGAAPGTQLSLAGQLLQPLLTYHWLHSGIVQCATNAVFFWLFGNRLESVLGSLRFSGFVLTAGAVAGLGYLMFESNASEVGIGASGIVAAAMAAHVLLHSRARALVIVPVVIVPVVVSIPTLVLIAMWAALQLRPISRLFEIGPADPVSWTAHVGGALAGLAMAPFCLRRSTARRARTAK